LVVFTEAATQSIEMILMGEKSVMMVVYEETIAFGKK
jgi:hypothetical protein